MYCARVRRGGCAGAFAEGKTLRRQGFSGELELPADSGIHARGATK
jgi:hypothetical protein